MTVHLVQIARGDQPRVAVVREPQLLLLREVESVLALARRALAEGRTLTAVAEGLVSAETLQYDDRQHAHV